MRGATSEVLLVDETNRTASLHLDTMFVKRMEISFLVLSIVNNVCHLSDIIWVIKCLVSLLDSIKSNN